MKQGQRTVVIKTYFSMRKISKETSHLRLSGPGSQRGISSAKLGASLPYVYARKVLYTANSFNLKNLGKGTSAQRA